MSNSSVVIVEIERVEPHSNANSLQRVFVKGVADQFVTAISADYQVGELVMYVPTDSMIPYDLAVLMGLPAKPFKDYRVRPVRLRGEWSVGVLYPIFGFNFATYVVGTEVGESLGITHYEPPTFTGNFRSFPEDLQALPQGISIYDLENLSRYPTVAERLFADAFLITEKLEGSNWWAAIDPDGQIHVGQRRYEIRNANAKVDLTVADPYTDDESVVIRNKPIIEHPFWAAFYDQDLDTYLYDLHREYPGYRIVIRGEIIGEGVQGNYYDLKGREVYLFDIEIGGQFVSKRTFINLASKAPAKVKFVPILALITPTDDLLSTRWTVDEALRYANGKSDLNPEKLREGIVIHPFLDEKYDPEIGRLVLKIRDAEYLATNG